MSDIHASAEYRANLVKIAELQMELGDGEGAREEIRAASATAEALGSEKLAERCRLDSRTLRSGYRLTSGQVSGPGQRLAKLRNRR